MYHGDPSHSGLSRSMPNVSGSPRVTESIKLDGAVYASPIVVDGVIVVATENDAVYAFDAQGKQLWHVEVGSPSPAQERACGDIDPLGITGTPIYSAQTGDVYLVAEHNGKVGHDMIALDLHTGKVRWRKSVDLPGPTPAAMQQRGALAITGGRVWVPFGAQAGDCSDYKGRVVGVRLDGTGDPVVYDPSTRRQGGIWNPAGPTVDPAGHLFVVSANGSSFPGDAYDHTNSVLELSPSGKLLDSFAPTQYKLKKNPTYWNANDIAPAEVAFPAMASDQSTNQLDVSAGKFDWSYQFVPNVKQTYVSKDPAHNSYWFPAGGTIALFLNLTKAPYNNVDFRKGISASLNRQTIATSDNSDDDAGARVPCEA